MPELPEVETVKRQLEVNLINKILDKPVIYYQNMIKTPIDKYQTVIENKKIESLSREGKFLIINLSENKKILFHLRMEGKLFIEKKEEHSLKHLSLFIPFKNDEYGLAFYDVRKFGVSYLLNKEERGPLENLGNEPFDIKDSTYLYESYHKSDKPIKELLLDQSIMSGLGNIYADEVCFASNLSPFKKANTLSKKDCENILKEAVRILNLAIENQGSTVRSYKASQHVSGNFQHLLKVYSHDKETCSICKKVKIEKWRLNGRGTSYCPICQKTGINIAITGKIASGKSVVSSYFKEKGFKVFSCDDEVKKLFDNPIFKGKLLKSFPYIFKEGEIDKNKISVLLFEDKRFKRKYLNLVYSEIKARMNDFIIANDGYNKVFEVPVLFDAKMDDLFTILIGVETNKQNENLLSRGENTSRNSFNQLNSYDKNKDKLNYIIENNGTLKQLKEKTLSVIKDLKEKGLISKN